MEIAKIEGWFLEQLSVLPFVESGSTQGEGMDWRCVAVMWEEQSAGLRVFFS
jgi:hypothetical protein